MGQIFVLMFELSDPSQYTEVCIMPTNPAIQAALIAAAVALGVGVLAQVVSVINQIITHRLTQRRERQKHYNEVYQKLFAPAISDVFLYIDMATAFRRGHDSSPEREVEVKDKAINYIKQNLFYGSPRLISAYHQIESYRFRDQTGFNPSFAELDFLYQFVIEFEYVIKQSSIFDYRSQKEQLSSVYEKMILYILNNRGHNAIASYSWRFDKNKFNRKNHDIIAYIVSKHKDFSNYLQERDEKTRDMAEKKNSGLPYEEKIKAVNRISKEQYRKSLRKDFEHLLKTERKIVTIMTRDKKDRDAILFDTSALHMEQLEEQLRTHMM
jgi:hypothetical protein